MILELKDFVNSKNALTDLMSVKMKFQLSYKVVNLVEKADKELGFYYEQIKTIAEKFGAKDENGEIRLDANGNVLFKDDCVESARKALNELNAIQIDVDDNLLFQYSDLENVELSPSSLFNLMPFIRK